jgi:hypothetical protein
VCVLASVVLVAGGVSAAWADGDPASDFLAFENDLYVPPQLALSPVVRDQLRVLLRRIRRDRLQVKVALIASPSNLGTETKRFNKPRSYAELLAKELSLVAPRDYLLVAMPAGLDTARYQGGAVAAVRPPLTRIAPPGAGPDALARAAGRGLLAMAAATGHQVPAALAAPFRDRRAAGSSHLGLIVALAVLGFAWVAAIGGAFALRMARAARVTTVLSQSGSDGAV